MSLRSEGVRVLVVEDESAVAMLIEAFLADLGCETSASAGCVAEALDAVAKGGFEVALLDFNLAGERVIPVAEALAERGVPFGFLTGYGAAALPPPFDGHPVLAKPFLFSNFAYFVQSLTAR